MFDFRYHVASLAAVFFALVIGILVGVALVSSGLLLAVFIATPGQLYLTLGLLVSGGSVASNHPDYAVSTDGRFLINQVADESPGSIKLILNVGK